MVVNTKYGHNTDWVVGGMDREHRIHGPSEGDPANHRCLSKHGPKYGDPSIMSSVRTAVATGAPTVPTAG